MNVFSNYYFNQLPPTQFISTQLDWVHSTSSPNIKVCVQSSIVYSVSEHITFFNKNPLFSGHEAVFL